MTGGSGVRLLLSQSMANKETLDAALLEELLSKIPTLSEVQELRRYSTGFSACSVLLVMPRFGSNTGRVPWVIKVGPREELNAEATAWKTASTFVAADNRITLVHEILDGDRDVGLLAFDYAGYSGSPPRDLSGLLKRPEALDAVKSTVRLVQEWVSVPTVREADLSAAIVQWTAGKLKNTPDVVRSSLDRPVLYSPDLGEVVSNPGYYISRNSLPTIRVQAPFSFTHGDLNLHNVLFNVQSPREPDLNRPLIIDMRHAGVDQWAITDLAKLEACVRFQQLPRIADTGQLEAISTFLNTSRASLLLAAVPDALGDKTLQERWQAIREIRAAAAQILGKNDERIYWACLLAYGVSTSTYSPFRPSQMSVLAYLDAAALFTRHFKDWDRTASQHVLKADEALSPAVSTPNAKRQPDTIAVLRAAGAGADVVLVCGGYSGKTSGVRPLPELVAHAHRELTGESPPQGMSAAMILDALSRRASRRDILRAFRNLGTEADVLREAEAIESLGPKVVVSAHYSISVLQSLRTSSLGPRLRRVEQADDLRNLDDLLGESVLYLPLFGDAETTADALRLTTAEQLDRRSFLGQIGELSSRRNRSIVLLFWGCEDWEAADFLAVRAHATARAAVPNRAFLVTEVNDENRDARLAAVEVRRIAAPLREVAEALASNARRKRTDGDAGERWVVDGERVLLPDVARSSKGLVRYFRRAGSLVGPVADAPSPQEFLLGAPPTIYDASERRIVRRKLVEDQLLPAISAAIDASDRAIRWVYVSGRPGAGVSASLCDAAVAIAENGWGPVVTLAHAARRPRPDWEEAGVTLADLYRACDTPPILVADLQECTLDDLDQLTRSVLDSDGQLVVIAGGRRSTMQASRRVQPKQEELIQIPDALEKQEWASLAAVLQRAGFSATQPIEKLTKRLSSTGIILAAVYEATDQRNRKFREIVEYEYARYKKDPLVQRAYRLVCTLGAYGHAISEYWLLKSLSHYSTSDSARILELLSDDLIIEQPRSSDGDRGAEQETLIRPRHRIIAAEVLDIASPEPQHRLLDFEELIASANMGSDREGLVVARLLEHRGELVRWVEDRLAAPVDRLKKLFDISLANQPSPGAEVHLRQHYALLLRRSRLNEEALDAILPALALDPENAATLHVAGLVHESRCLEAWRRWCRAPDPDLEASARTQEAEARRFFADSRRLQPAEEHGYEAEARLVRKKYDVFVDGGKDGAELGPELSDALWLLWQASRQVPQNRRKEIPQTKARLLRSIGRVDEAIALTEDALAKTDDRVARARIRTGLAALYMEGKRPGDAAATLRSLIEDGERTPAVYLLLDDALRGTGSSARERVKQLRESAEEFNRRHVETLVRFAELLAYNDDWDGVRRTLARADDAGRVSLSSQERERVRCIVAESIYSQTDRVFAGEVVRMRGRHEAQVRLDGVGAPVFCRLSPSAGRVHERSRVRCRLALRVRGMRAVGVEPEPES